MLSLVNTHLWTADDRRPWRGRPIEMPKDISDSLTLGSLSIDGKLRRKWVAYFVLEKLYIIRIKSRLITDTAISEFLILIRLIKHTISRRDGPRLDVGEH